jgi:hypothetical protein
MTLLLNPKRTRASEIIEQVAAEFFLAPQQINSQRHSRGNVLAARVEIAKRMDAEKIERRYIQEALGGIDHTMVSFYLGRLTRVKPTGLRWRKPRIKHLACHNCKLCYFPEAKPVVPVKKRSAAPRFKLPYAGFDPREYAWRTRD